MNCNQKEKKPETEKEETTRSTMWTSLQQILEFRRLKVKLLQQTTDLIKFKNRNLFEAPIFIKKQTIFLEVTNRMTDNLAENPSTI